MKRARLLMLAFGMASVASFAFTACEKRTVEVRVDRVDPPMGTVAGGEQITIFGRGFVPGKMQAEVRFGRRKAENVIIASEQEITVVTPAGDRGPSDVSVMFSDGKAFKIAEGFHYKMPGDPAAARKAWEKEQ